MKEGLLAFYHRLPAPMRSAAASLHGVRLNAERYGPDAERLVEEAAAREAWTAEKWERYRGERLAALLEGAARSVPFYRRQWEARRRKGDRAPVDLLASWPVLSKDDVRENPEAFLAEGADPRRLTREQTSGTSGKPLRLYRRRPSVRAWFALFEARARRWNGVSRTDRWAMLGGQLVVPVARRKPPYWVWNAGLHQLYMSSYHLSPETIPHYLEAMRRYEVTYVLGYASSMATIAHGALESGARAPSLRVAISNAEPLFDAQRAQISAAFGCPVRDTYGMAEIVCGGSECAEGSLHLWPEAGLLEILRDDADAPAAPGEAGRLVATGLLTPEMPLVRYALGDRGAGARSGAACACGRTLPRLAAVEGRSDDVVVTPEGRRVGRLDPVFKADLRIREAQIVQESLDRVRVLLLPAAGYGEEDERTVRRGLAQRLGSSVAVTIETVAEIPRGPGGKFRAVVSRLDRAARAGAGNAGGVAERS
jgi:phenylacetate-CoA ligase